MRWTQATTTNTGNLDDFDFSGADLLLCNNASLLTIRGLLAGVGGQKLAIVSVGAGQVDLSNQDTGDGTAANRLICIAKSGKTSLAAGTGSATLEYDATAARWRLVAHEQGAWITPVFSASDYFANGSMTWTVDSTDVSTFKYKLNGRQLTVLFTLNATSVGGTPNSQLLRLIPGGFTSPSIVWSTYYAVNAGTAETGPGIVQAYSGNLAFFRNGSAANWSAATNSTQVNGQITFEVD